MGIELDVLVGHPEYELLFMATQVARAAGLTYPSQSAKDFTKTRHAAGGFITLGSIQGQIANFTTCPPCDAIGRKLKETALMFSEAALYKMLLRGHSESTEPFRRWVTEEVLPTIRKTGSYNAAESSDPIAVGIMDELKLLRGELVELKEIVKALGLPVSAVKALLSRGI